MVALLDVFAMNGTDASGQLSQDRSGLWLHNPHALSGSDFRRHIMCIVAHDMSASTTYSTCSSRKQQRATRGARPPKISVDARVPSRRISLLAYVYMYNMMYMYMYNVLEVYM